MSRKRRSMARTKRAKKHPRSPRRRLRLRVSSLDGIKVLLAKRSKLALLFLIAAIGVAAFWILAGPPGVVDIDASMESGWVVSETRDRENRLVFPVGLVEKSANFRWANRREEGLDGAYLFTGYHPSAVLGIWQKLFRVEDISYSEDDTWRRQARVTIHLSQDRGHEAEWFENISGKRLYIQAADEPLIPEQILVISDVRFERKEINIAVAGKVKEKRQVFVAILNAKETVAKALYNATIGKLSKAKIGTFLGSLLAAVLAGVIVRSFPKHRRDDNRL